MIGVPYAAKSREEALVRRRIIARSHFEKKFGPGSATEYVALADERPVAVARLIWEERYHARLSRALGHYYYGSISDHKKPRIRRRRKISRRALLQAAQRAGSKAEVARLLGIQEWVVRQYEHLLDVPLPNGNETGRRRTRAEIGRQPRTAGRYIAGTRPNLVAVKTTPNA